jgi:SAM-dependent methyltransferase
MLYQEFIQTLKWLDENILHLDPIGVQQGFEDIPLEIFGKIQIDRPAEFPNLLNWLPDMPASDIQQLWTGNSGHELMKQSVSFIRTTVGKYHELTCRPLNQGKVLDFGCGWGRLIRLLYKYVPAENIYGVDPWDESIHLCRQTNLHGNFSISDYMPVTLPVPTSVKFELVIAFSVFTHLSEKSFNMCAAVIQEYLPENGILALTIRPREFWPYIYRTTPFYSKIELPQVLDDHDQHGFAFYPYPKKILNGEYTYGETSVSLNYLKNAFPSLKIAGVEWSETDPLQIIIFLQKRQ